MGLTTPPTEKDLCKPCAVAMERGHTVKRITGKAIKVTCASCERRRYGLTYEVTEKPRSERK